MADDRAAPDGALPREIELLLFNSAGVNMAVETGQVNGILSSEQAGERAIKGRALCGLLGTGPADSTACPKVLLIRDTEELYGFGIDGVDSIIPVQINAIQPLPRTLSSVAGVRPFWGVIPRGNKVVLLIDLFRLKGLMARQSERSA